MSFIVRHLARVARGTTPHRRASPEPSQSHTLRHSLACAQRDGHTTLWRPDGPLPRRSVHAIGAGSSLGMISRRAICALPLADRATASPAPIHPAPGTGRDRGCLLAVPPLRASHAAADVGGDCDPPPAAGPPGEYNGPRKYTGPMHFRPGCRLDVSGAPRRIEAG